MVAVARRKDPRIDWRNGDLATVDLGRTFEAIVLAGNVMIFLAPMAERSVLANMARHLLPNGLVIAGFELQPGGLTTERYDRLAAEAGLTPAERWATWGGDPWQPGDDYAVTVHRR